MELIPLIMIPNNSDTDGDGLNDDDEIALGYDPNNPLSNSYIIPLIITILIVIISIISLVIVGKKVKKKRKESFNEALISEIEAKIKEGEKLKGKGELENVLNICNEQLLSSEKLYDSVSKEQTIIKIKDLIDNTIGLKIEENIKKGAEIKGKGELENILNIYNEQLLSSEKLYDSVNKEQTIIKIKNLIDNTIGLIIEENIKKGEQLNKEGDYVNEVRLLKEQLENTKSISDTSKRENLREKIWEYLKPSQILKIKSIIIDLGSKYPKLKVIDIKDKCGEEEGLIFTTLQDMIKNREISAKYIKSSKAVEFSQQIDVEEIDKLMKSFDEWEKEGKDKKK